MAVWAVCLSLLVTLLCASAWRSITYYPEQVGKPTNTNYDSPYAACNVSGIVRGYSGNQISYLVAEGATANAWLPQPLPINLSRGTGYDTCGEWLNAVVWDEEAGIVRGYYHQEWNCHYSDNSFTNKSVAYAESHDGGRTFIKPGYPNNTIILPPRGNTTRQHQTGQGDHTVVVKGDYMYLYFLDWDGYQHTRVSVARATRASGGVPGSWWKWYKGNFSQPGLHGNDDMLYNMSSASSIRCRRRQDDFIALQPNGKVGLQVIQSADGLHWQKLPVTVVPTDFANWTRGPDSGELYAYVSPVGNAGMHDVDETFWLYYTYLQVWQSLAALHNSHRLLCSFLESHPPPPSQSQLTHRHFFLVHLAGGYVYGSLSSATSNHFAKGVGA
eukprot:TRINITY_DN9811_c0_g1_i2.p1 TRINITY_DN9811_c0_g1~~TRINITY_DN9811_c0_g1_i2.p1  ORF type:complete len:385 (+),score=49.37 TRINITY_DN9811_c0_g1_i2:20-1174(+)